MKIDLRAYALGLLDEMPIALLTLAVCAVGYAILLVVDQLEAVARRLDGAVDDVITAHDLLKESTP